MTKTIQIKKRLWIVCDKVKAIEQIADDSFVIEMIDGTSYSVDSAYHTEVVNHFDL